MNQLGWIRSFSFPKKKLKEIIKRNKRSRISKQFKATIHVHIYLGELKKNLSLRFFMLLTTNLTIPKSKSMAQKAIHVVRIENSLSPFGSIWINDRI